MRPSVLLLVLSACTPDGGLKVYNTPPDVSITSPADGSSFAEGLDVTFVASVHDSQQGLSELELVWNLDDGSALVGEQTLTDAGVLFVAHGLPAGDRVVTLLAIDDKSESGEDSVDLHIVPDEVPTVSFLAPLDGDVVIAEDRLRVEVQVADADEGDLSRLTLAWSGAAAVSAAPASADSAGTAAFYIESLTPGTQELGVTVTDSLGATGSALVAIDAVLADADLDGHRDTAWGGDDCDDADAAVYPGATEVCNGIDDDCDGTIDEDDAADAPTWYADLDLDGFGDAAATTNACEAPDGWVADDTDCDDADGSVFPDAVETCDGVDQDCDGGVDEEDATGEPTWYTDADGDGFGDAAAPVEACDIPAGTVANSSDCDDTDAGTFPGATEVCDGEDDDCDGTVDEDDAADAPTWYVDADADGFGGATTTRACSQPTDTFATSTDCDDGDAGVYPGADEYCDGEDDDCDGTVDEDDAVDASTWYVDADGDSWGEPTVTAVACDAPAGFVEYDTDCDDGDAAFHPGAAEGDCADANDYNCDGSVGYDDDDGDGWAACEECDDTVASINPDGTEVCNGADDDCDGTLDEPDAVDASTWYADADGDDFGDAGSTTPACDEPAGYVADASDCDDGDATENPSASERCDGDDDDCDGAIDEDSAIDAPTWYADADGDTYGDAAVTDVECSAPSSYVADATDCDDGSGGVHPGAVETCDGEDDDCDAEIDEDAAVDVRTWYADADGDTYGDASVDDRDCDQPAGFVGDATDCDDTVAAINPAATEVCNGDDDDCDALTDETDAADALTWYADVDGDAFGDPETTTPACEEPSGYVADATDCDDGDATENPAAAERCDGDDDDCDGAVDEDSATDAATWYADADGDTYGDPSAADVECTAPSGYVADATDCDDTRSSSHPSATEYCNTRDDDCDGAVDEDSAVDAATWYADADGDAYGNASVTDIACASPAGFVADATDCDDARATSNPAATEYCNTRDDDCDGTVDEDAAVDAVTWYADADGDTYGNPAVSDIECAAPAGYVADATDCDDTRSTSHPTATEYCNTRDDDCDGSADEDSADAATWYRDADSDTYGNAAVTDVECAAPSGYVADATDCDDTRATVSPADTEYCNTRDDDCDGTVDEDAAADATTWYADADGDTYGNASVTDIECAAPAGYVANATDCDDTRATSNPAATEYCNTRDDDCDGAADEDSAADATTWYRDADSDTYGNAAVSDVECAAPAGYVADATDCDDTRSTSHPTATEYCNTRDDDCDGSVDEDSADAATWYRDADSDTYGNVAVTDVECAAPSGYVADATDCDDTRATVSPADTEYCNTRDDNCDGSVDESAADATTWYADADSDTYGNAAVTDIECAAPAGYVANATDCDDTRATSNPAATEYCNTRDDDCDGSVDETSAADAATWYRDADADAHGDIYTTTPACAAPSGYVALADDCDDTDRFTNPSATEYCDGEDDDCDGSVDEDDAADAGNWYLDNDGDEFGQTAVYVVACDEPAGYAAEADDCNDADAYASPYATEYCDGDDDDCDGSVDEDSAVDATRWYADADSDTYGDSAVSDLECYAPSGYVADPTDCDDTSAAISPGDPELCDASDTDEDCDGVADDNDADVSAATKSTFYADADADGYAGTTSSLRCDATSTYLATSTDCDDASAAISPGDTEVCDALDTDEDCDGTGDEAGASGCTTYYEDADGDGYGDTASACLCSSSGTYTATNDDDCDDADADVHPGAEESESNGADDDCDGITDEAGLEWPLDDTYVTNDLPTYVAGSATMYQRYFAEGNEDWDADGYGEFVWAQGSGYVYFSEAPGTSATVSTRTGLSGTLYAAAIVGDQDGDGLKEVLVGAYTVSTYGRAYLVQGDEIAAQGVASVAATTQATTTFTAGSPVDDFGYALANAGDVYGDGVDDYLVAASVGTTAARVFLYDGPAASGSVATGSAAATFSATTASDFGKSIESDGDLDGDGVPDIVIGAAAHTSSTGKVYILDGASASGSINVDTSADAILTGESTSDYAGAAIDVTDDLNDDGYDDLLVGAYGAGTYGRAYVFLGPVTTSSVSAADLVVEGESGVNPGYFVEGLGDIDDDGDQDFAVGGQGATVALYAYEAGAATLYPEDAFAGFTTYRYAPYAVASVGDLDADGIDDFVFPGTYSASPAYRTFVIHANFRRVDATGSDSIVSSTIGGTELGTSVAGAGDFNGDGFDDLITGGHAMDYGSVSPGGAVVYFGPHAESELLTAYDVKVTGVVDAEDVGTAVAGGADFDGDVYDDIVIGASLDDTIGANAGAVWVFGGAGTGYTDTTSGADATFRGAATGDEFGWSVAVVPDIDGDTYDELLVGAPYHDNPGLQAGRVYLYGAPFAATGEAAMATITAEATGDNLGYAVHGGGDVDGDGFPDLLLGASDNDDTATDAGAAYLFTSMPSGTVAASTADTIFRGETRQDYFGTSVAILGDANGDGYDDLAVGAPYYSTGDAGRVYVYYGPVMTGALNASTADWTLDGESGNLLMGTEVAPAGDIDGDGLMDLAFSGSLSGSYGRGGVIHGPFENRLPFWLYSDVTVLLRRGISGVGDSNGDGKDDWAFGANRGSTSGELYIEEGR